MSSLFPLTGDQARGADPDINAWLSASAGTGKTQVLTARVLRLLLKGVRPNAILALTFTKAGASEMARRIRERLAGWVRMPDRELKAQLFAIHADGHDDPQVWAYARTLFASVIDAPGGGLAIQTIHSFCQTLLASFPEEAGLAPGFAPLDERDLGVLRAEVLTELIQSSIDGGELGFIDRIEQLSLTLGEAGARAYLDRCCAALDALEAMPALVVPWLRGQFGLPRADPAEWLTRQCADDALDVAALRRIAAANRTWGAATGIKRAEAIDGWLARDAAARAGSFAELLSGVCTAKGQLLSDYTSKPALADVADDAARLADQLLALPRTAAAMAASDRMAGALEAGRSFARAYALRKRREGLVDFDDLIARAVALLASEGRAEWIRYKLDSRIDHILVDEAQDTNARQWAIVASLAEEYFAGASARDGVTRTLFVVGDYKQAIYGFQGTSPLFFEAARRRFAEQGDAAEHPVHSVDITTNFRSSPPVLALVDGVIAALGPERLGLFSSDAVRHSAAARDAGGRVTLWPLERAEDGEGDDGDSAAGEEGWIDSATRRVADRIARSVRSWIDHGIDGEAVRAKDVMVLVRQRSDIAGLVVSRLQAHGVPVAGVDRLRLQTPVAVQDLLAAARFALQPLDDLSLACLLVSPLIGWTHDELDRHGRQRQRLPLWTHLQMQPELVERLAPLRDLLNLAGYAPPYRFFETILSGPMQGRARLLARLGNAARDPIEELVSQALQFETRVGASLHGFLRWFDAGDIDIKRELDSSADEVRVMTVHGAKGLQARIVILADAAVDPDRGRKSAPVWPIDDETLPLLAVPKDELPDALALAQADRDARDKEEHWRLLYVALTRAERMLFVAGTLGAKKDEPPPHSWYAAVAPVVAQLGARAAPADDAWGEALVWSVRGRPAPQKSDNEPGLPPAAIPDWARRAAPDEPRPLRPLAPSAIGEAEALAVPQPPPGEAAMRAAERGRLIHALFERLPSVAPADRRAAAARWLDRAAPGFDASERGAMVEAVLAVLDDPAHAGLFGASSLAEVPFSALVDGRVIAGTVDRLIVSDDAVLIVDFKTGAAIPDTAEAIAPGYLAQMGAYAAALGVVFAGRRIDAGLLYTAGPRLLMIPPALLDAHKPRFVDDKANSSATA